MVSSIPIYLQRVKTPPTSALIYDTKQSYSEASVMLELWRMQINPLLSSLPGSLWPGEVEPDRVLSMGQIELNCVITLN